MKGVTIFSSDECVICMDNPSISVFLQCAHACTCIACSDMIVKAKMSCPLCRSVITTVSSAKNEASVPMLQLELDDFATRKEDYVKTLRSKCASNACFVGKSKLARSVGRAAGSELEERVMQNQGTDRYGGMKPTYEVTEDKQMFTVKYKVQGKRKPVEETYSYIANWSDAKDALLEVLDKDRLSTMDICIYYPEYFWLAKYHKQMADLEEVSGAKRR